MIAKSRFVEIEISLVVYHQSVRTLRALGEREDAEDFARKQLIALQQEPEDEWKKEFSAMLYRFLAFITNQEQFATLDDTQLAARYDELDRAWESIPAIYDQELKKIIVAKWSAARGLLWSRGIVHWSEEEPKHEA